MITARLTEYLEILEVRYSGNTIGIDVPYYTPLFELYGSITGQAGSTSFDQGETYTDRISFYLRFNPGIPKKGVVLRYNDEIYTIENVTHIRRNEATVINCKATS